MVACTKDWARGVHEWAGMMAVGLPGLPMLAVHTTPARQYNSLQRLHDWARWQARGKLVGWWEERL